jgi:heat shock protein HtpX
MANQVKTILLLGVLSAILIGFGAILGKGWMLAFAALALVLNVGAYFFSDRIVLKMHKAKPVSEIDAPRLYGMVRELSARAEIPVPRLYVIEAPEPNAFATGRNPENAVVAVTTGILDILSERELRGVIAHELAHVKNRDILVATIAAAIAAAISMIANMLQFSAIFGGMDDEEGPSPIAMIGLALIAPIAATMIQLGVSRSREYLADETGAELSGDPDALASALLKLETANRGGELISGEPATASLYIVNPLSGVEGITSLFSTHPPIRERVRRLRVLAGYPELHAA